MVEVPAFKARDTGADDERNLSTAISGARRVGGSSGVRYPATILLSAHNNLEEACKSCQAVATQEDAKLIFERYSSFLLATLSIEVDRLEHLISSAYPEFKYIDLEVL